MNASQETPAPARKPKTWIITQGHIGHQIKCRGIAAALGAEPEEFTVLPPAPWRWAAPWGPAHASPLLEGPFPDLLLASGRQSIPYAREIRRRSQGGTFVVVIDDPVVSAKNFDMVWTNSHDLKAHGENVVKTLTSPNTLTPERLAESALALLPRLPAHEGRHRVGVVLGGHSRHFPFDAKVGRRLAEDLERFARTNNAFLVVTPSRRTPESVKAELVARLGPDIAWIWDGSGENPYAGVLGSSEALIVTCDSVNMLGEAASTGHPVYGWKLPGQVPKFDRFHAGLIAAGALRWFDRRLESWTYTPINATREIADAITSRMAARKTKATATG